jgi:integrase
MRRGELLRLRWADLDLDNNTLHIPVAKNGSPRTIPLSSEAVGILETVPKVEDRVFPTTASAVSQSWRRLVKRAGIEDLHFHDLRHEAISRFFELGLSIAEVALISGHKDVRQLFRYTHLRAEDVAKKLR